MRRSVIYRHRNAGRSVIDNHIFYTYFRLCSILIDMRFSCVLGLNVFTPMSCDTVATVSVRFVFRFFFLVTIRDYRILPSARG